MTWICGGKPLKDNGPLRFELESTFGKFRLRPAHSEVPFRDCDLPLDLLGLAAVHFLRGAIVVVEEEEEVGIFIWKEAGRL